MTARKSGNPLISVALGALAILIYARGANNATPEPTVPIHTDDLGTGAQFRAALVGPDATKDAAYLGAVWGAIADTIERDGRAAKPLLTDRTQLEALLANAGALAVDGRTQGKYPGVPPILARTWETQFPRETGPLTPSDRAQAARIYRALGAGAQGAGGP